MGVRNSCIGWTQYATASDGFAQQLWAQAWQAQNYASIRPGWSVVLTGLVDPTPAGGTCQLSYELHLDTPDQATADALWTEFNAHLTANSTDETEYYAVE
jgi:hypothetical protein